ncbi:hypothetical protein [Alkalihalobacterium alkalinitrilicum]|uniref:hypothetical protein n=1 Tax=Alkalihalobacterium alkalinitrilicum TaxID=427920 RepID=UPI001EE46166|nr:hypothetical protein [Alkalihalobacterium alkalinitrilicum]
MYILTYDNCKILPNFLHNLIPSQAQMMNFTVLITKTRTKHCPQNIKGVEYIIGIAPYKKALPHNPLVDNSGSIPDAWVCGKNFNLLFEFKIRGSLNEGQINAHKRLLHYPNIEVIRLNWDIVFNALHKLDTQDTILNYLIQQFMELKTKFQSKRQSSGMPKGIIGHVNKDNELYFKITGSKEVKPYRVEKVYLESQELLSSELKGIQSARRFIASYVYENQSKLPLQYIGGGEETVVNDYCVVPGRAEKKNQWNQWRIGAILKLC